MKFIASILIWVSLGIGAVATVTAYMPPVTLPAEAFTTTDEAGATVPLLSAVAVGPLVAQDGAEAPAFPAGTPLTAETLGAMRDAGVTRVKVKSFGWERWTHKWWFIGASVGLVLGGVLTRMASKAAVMQPHESAEESPEFALKASRDEVVGLMNDLPTMADDDARLRAIVKRLGELQQTHLAAYPAGRERIIARHGLGGYAQRMDAFAAADRNVNRAWSAAADGHLSESMDSLDDAATVLEDAVGRYGKG